MQILQDNINGIEARIKELRGTLGSFQKAQGLDEEAERVRQEAEALAKREDDLKKEIAILQKQKNVAIAATGKALAEKMSTFLTTGSAYFDITETGEAEIGYINPNSIRVPYTGLSGGEKAQFDPALCAALGATVAIVEAAEIDETHLTEMLARIGSLQNGTQVIISTCHPPKTTKGWQVVEVQ